MSDRLNYNTLAPAAMKALGGVHVYLHSQADLPKNLIDMAYLRTSQINGCAYCIDMHSHDLIAQGVPVSTLLLVSAWHEAAALGLHKRLNLEPSVHSWNEGNGTAASGRRADVRAQAAPRISGPESSVSVRWCQLMKNLMIARRTRLLLDRY